MSKSSSRSGGGSGPSAASKALDEANLKILREVAHIQANRHCFECGQRGPTYVDVTIGSFICMTCSGLLRGLTPPHRVKSISMASFTSEEIQNLKARGNEYCKKVWLATYTARDNLLSSDDADRKNNFKSHLSAKYEQKRYYVDPSKIPELADIQAQNVRALSSGSGVSGTGSLSSGSNMTRSPSLSSASSGSSLSQVGATTQNAPSPIMNNLRNSSGISRIPSSQTLPDIKPLSSLLNPSSIQPINFINNLSTSNSAGHQPDKIINTNPKDPWGSGDPTSAGAAEFNANFANFDEAFSEGITTNTNGGHSSAPSFDPFSSPVKSNVNHQIGFIANFDKPLLPAPTQPGIKNDVFNGNNGTSSNGPAGNGGQGMGYGDRYAALKDLDELFKHGGDSDVVAHNTNNGLTSSASVPVNLSSSFGSNGWSQTTYNQLTPTPNPFSQLGTSPSNNRNSSEWNSNPHNPFASPASSSGWPSSSPGSNAFGASPAQNSSPFGFGQPIIGHGHGHGIQSKPVFNPFAVPPTAAATISSTDLNPRNPFL